MPDDDYEVVRVGYEPKSFPKVREEDTVAGERQAKNNAKRNKAKQIEALLDFIDRHITKVKEDDFEVYAAVKNLTKVLRLMNGIE